MSLFRGNRSETNPLIKQSVDYLDERFPFWLTKVLNIGKPVMDTSIKSAAIEYDRKSGDFTFRMNPDFAATLTDEERAFLMSHEAMHIVRNDIKLHADARFPDKEALNQAMDAIINDTLTNNGLTAPEWAVSGPRDIGFDCEDVDLEDVYETIIENRPPPEGGGDGEGDEQSEGGEGEQDDEQQGKGKSKQQKDDRQDDAEGEAGDEGDQDQAEGGEGQQDDSQGDESEGDGEGQGDAAEGDLIDATPDDEGDEGEGQGEGEGTDGDGEGEDAEGDGEGEGEGEGEADGEPKPMAGGGHESWGDQSGAAEAAEEHMEMHQEQGSHGEGDGVGYIKVEEDITEKDIPNLDFEAIFKLVEPELVDGFGMGRPKRSDWRRPRRSTMSLYPHTNLPSKRDDSNKLALASKRLELVVFLDNSGSVSSHDIAMFREIAKILPGARADYRFVVAGSTAGEVSKADMFDQSRMLPSPGAGASVRDAEKIAQRGPSIIAGQYRDFDRSKREQLERATGQKFAGYHKLGEDAKRTAAKMIEPGFRGPGAAYNMSTEFDAMNAWIMQAIESGQLRGYPKSVLVITDCGSGLTSATEDEASRWTVLTNDPQHHRGGYYKRTDRTAYISRGCKIPQANFHALQEFVLDAAHVRKKARV